MRTARGGESASPIPGGYRTIPTMYSTSGEELIIIFPWRIVKRGKTVGYFCPNW